MRILRFAFTITMFPAAITRHQMGNQEIPLFRFLDFDFLISVLAHSRIGLRPVGSRVRFLEIMLFERLGVKEINFESLEIV